MGLLSLFIISVGLLDLLVCGRCFRIPSGCEVRVNSDLPEPQPLLLVPGGSPDGFGFKLPTRPGDIVHFSHGERIRLVCPGSSNFLSSLGPDVQDTVATCATGTVFTVGGRLHEFSHLSCQVQPVPTARRTGTTCYNERATQVEIGFHANDDFYRIMDICFDDQLLRPLYSRYDLVAEIAGYQTNFPRPSWLRGSFYPDVSPNALYSRNQQIATLGLILGDPTLGNHYISNRTNYFLARGHLVAKGCYVYGSQRRATFHYVNSVPQWQTFNSGNWNSMEQDLRWYASSRGANLVVYAGAHGITTLPDTHGVQRELYLLYNENHAMPVPMLLWMVAYNPRTKAGVALVGVNNPYLATIPSEYIVCSDISHRIAWLTWDRQDIAKGFSYACTVNEFRRTVDTLPNFSVTQLLA